MNETIRMELDKLKEIIINAIPVKQIYLFGSYAYGTPHKDSDLDLYVVLKDGLPMRDLDAGLQKIYSVSTDVYINVTAKNIIEMAVYCTIRQVIKATWLNDRDNYQFPNNKNETDIEFQNDCLVNVLFDNNIQSAHGVNHWIPFTEQEVNAKDKFQSNFMSDLLKGKTFSPEAQGVLNSGKKLWKYYHSRIMNDRNASVDASFYDIRGYFQGRSAKGTMNQKSTDETYNALIKDFRQKLSALAEKIKPKVYEYGFLLE